MLKTILSGPFVVSAAARCLAHDAEKNVLPHDQGQRTVAQSYMLDILSFTGKRVVAAIIRKERIVYPPGAERLKDVVTNETSLTESDRWLFGSLLLLVFRLVLYNGAKMVSAPCGRLTVRTCRMRPRWRDRLMNERTQPGKESERSVTQVQDECCTCACRLYMWWEQEFFLVTRFLRRHSSS